MLNIQVLFSSWPEKINIFVSFIFFHLYCNINSAFPYLIFSTFFSVIYIKTPEGSFLMMKSKAMAMVGLLIKALFVFCAFSL